MRRSATTKWAAIGLLASMSLAACAHGPRTPSQPAKETVLTVRVKEAPPADLAICPAAPDGFPEDQTARMPADVRAAAQRLALGFRDVTDKYRRLVEWFSPGACSAPDGS